MPKSTTQTAEAPRHFSITKLDLAPISELLEREQHLRDEIQDTDALKVETERDVKHLRKTAKARNRQQMETLAVLETKLRICENRLPELEQQLADVEAEAGEIILGGRFGFLSGIGRLTHAESGRKKSEIATVFRPACVDDTEARELAGQTKKFSEFYNRINGWNFGRNASERIHRGLSLLDVFEKTGSLETLAI